MKNFFKNLSIRTWLILWVVFLFAFLAIILFVSYTRGNTLKEAFDETKEESEEMHAVVDASLAVNRADMLIHDFLISGANAEQEKSLEDVLQSARVRVSTLEDYSANLANEIGLFAEIKSDYNVFEEKARSIFSSLQKKSNKVSEISVTMKEMDIVSHRISGNMDMWREFNKKEVLEAEVSFGIILLIHKPTHSRGRRRYAP